MPQAAGLPAGHDNRAAQENSGYSGRIRGIAAGDGEESLILTTREGGRTSTRSPSVGGASASERVPLTRKEHCSITWARVRPEGWSP